MATLSSILAWKIPWREELGGLQSLELQRVGHDGTHVRTYTHTHTLRSKLRQNYSRMKKKEIL